MIRGNKKEVNSDKKEVWGQALS